MHTWDHSELGQFKFGEYEGWLGAVSLPLFRKFTYRAKEDPSASIQLRFDAYEPDETPSEEMIQVALATVANHEQLVATGLKVLHDDFHGRGADSGMWWTDDVDHILEILGDRYSKDVLDSPPGLYRLLGCPSIDVQETGYGYDKPCAIIGFESEIDIEHGIGLLTDGKQIIGSGYRCDAGAFPEFATS